MKIFFLPEYLCGIGGNLYGHVPGPNNCDGQRFCGSLRRVLGEKVFLGPRRSFLEKNGQRSPYEKSLFGFLDGGKNKIDSQWQMFRRRIQCLVQALTADSDRDMRDLLFAEAYRSALPGHLLWEGTRAIQSINVLLQKMENAAGFKYFTIAFVAVGSNNRGGFGGA